jgi:hypothetical protein
MTASSEPAVAPRPKVSRPSSVTLAAALQLLIAVAFLSIPLIGAVYGADVQAAAEAAIIRQGLPATVLADNGVRLDEGGAAIVLPVAIALCVAALAVLNLAGKRVGRILTWIVQPLVLLGNLAIMASQQSAVRVVESVFASSGDAELQRIDVQALFDAAFAAYPSWLPPLVNVRNVVVILGSVLVIVLLALPSARSYFRGQPDEVDPKPI